MTKLDTESALVAACIGLIDGPVELSPSERKLVSNNTESLNRALLDSLRAKIAKGLDPLGEAFSEIRSAKIRRTTGAVYTPRPIVTSMLRWIASVAKPARIVDPGAGSGRFIIAAGRQFPNAQLVAIEMDPLAALMLRTNLHVSGMAARTKIFVRDYRRVTLPKIKGVTAFIGNPPYVRHHDIDDEWKNWYVRAFSKLGLQASALAGLHIHFFLKTRRNRSPRYGAVTKEGIAPLPQCA